MNFLLGVAGLTLRDRVRRSDIREEIRVEQLLLRVERSQLRTFSLGKCFGHLPRGDPGQTKETLERLDFSADLGTSWKTAGSPWVFCLKYCQDIV